MDWAAGGSRGWAAEGPQKLNAGNLIDDSILERYEIVVLGNIVSKTNDPIKNKVN